MLITESDTTLLLDYNIQETNQILSNRSDTGMKIMCRLKKWAQWKG